MQHIEILYLFKIFIIKLYFILEITDDDIYDIYSTVFPEDSMESDCWVKILSSQFHPIFSSLSLLFSVSQLCNGLKKEIMGWTDISLVPVSFSNASGHGKLDPSFSISANALPASSEPDMSQRCSGVPGSAILHKPSKNWNWKIVLVKYLLENEKL